MIFLQWVARFAGPAVLSVLIQHKEPSQLLRIVYIHGLVIISILLLHWFGIQLQWDFSLTAIAVVTAATLITTILLRFQGVLYALSSTIQEVNILLSALLLLGAYGTPVAAVLTGIFFVAAHQLNSHEIAWKIPLLVGWVIVSVYIYLYFQSPLLNISIHMLIGAILIKCHLLLKQPVVESKK